MSASISNPLIAWAPLLHVLVATKENLLLRATVILGSQHFMRLGGGCVTVVPMYCKPMNRIFHSPGNSIPFGIFPVPPCCSTSQFAECNFKASLGTQSHKPAIAPSIRQIGQCCINQHNGKLGGVNTSAQHSRRSRQYLLGRFTFTPPNTSCL